MGHLFSTLLSLTSEKKNKLLLRQIYCKFGVICKLKKKKIRDARQLAQSHHLHYEKKID